MKKILIEMALPTGISFFVGCVVPLPFNLLLHQPWLPLALAGGLTGLAIGVLAQSVFLLIARWINQKPVSAFLTVFFIIAVGTGVGTWFLATKDLILISGFVGLAETVGILATFLFYSYSRRLNRQLQEKKDQLTQKKIF